MTRKLTTLVRWLAGALLPAVAHAAGPAAPAEPALVMVAPFVILLLAIALMPFIHQHHWENHYPKVALGLGLITVVYYVGFLQNAPRMLTSLVEYGGFMALIGSLFVIAGGIHINLTGRATPTVNTGLLALGAVLANLIGTTGASMLLIRPFLRINQPRVAPYHVVFFIFLVSNIGGGLTPIGDPPLFLGYLKGVPFLWLLTKPQVLGAWLVCVGALLAVFYVVDALQYRQHQAAPAEAARDRLELTGAHNFLWLLAIIALVLVQKADWLKGLEHWPVCTALGHPLGWGAPKVVENFITLSVAALMIGLAGLSHKFAKPAALRANEFGFGPIREVGFLFAGIFATMVPALDLLEKHAVNLGIQTVPQFYWGTGLLSAVLDNAPTYLNFLAAAFGLQQLSVENPAHMTKMLADAHLASYVVAVALGAVLFGAGTYIGNGPNFMVKSIAEARGVKCPSFFGYVCKYSLPILLPLFALVAWLFLR